MKIDDRFQIGSETLLGTNPDQTQTVSLTNKSFTHDAIRDEALKEIRLRVGTLLKTETVSLLLGAGASVDCGGVLIGSVPLNIEQQIVEEGISGSQRPRIRQWLRLFYEAARTAGDPHGPVNRQTILARYAALRNSSASPLKANFEDVLATLQRWRAALPDTGGRLRLDGSVQLATNAELIDECQRRASHALAQACNLPTAGKTLGLVTFTKMVRKLLTRPLNLKRVNVFTLNYDTLVEQAADATGTVLLDGFVGTQTREFRPESYEQDLYFPAETTEGRVHRFDRVLQLYKLHGSITWSATEPRMSNPYGVESLPYRGDESQKLLIYPTPTKYGEALSMPYSELFRRFASTLARPQSVLFAIGYGFGDAHVNAIVRQALAIPSFTLVIVDPSPKSSFVRELSSQEDSRIWLSVGSRMGTLTGFVEDVLPDLHEEDILRRVSATHNALAPDRVPQRG